MLPSPCLTPNMAFSGRNTHGDKLIINPFGYAFISGSLCLMKIEQRALAGIVLNCYTSCWNVQLSQMEFILTERETISCKKLNGWGLYKHWFVFLLYQGYFLKINNCFCRFRLGNQIELFTCIKINK